MVSKSPTVRTTRRRLQSVEPPPFALGLDLDIEALDEHLPSLAVHIERAFGANEVPHIIRISRDGVTDEGIDVGMRAIDDIDDSVVSALTGFIAPDDWLAIGVSTGGNAYPIDAGSDHRRSRVRFVHLVTRRSTTASVVHIANDEPQLFTATGASEGPIGRVDDVCRRALGLATSPPGSTLELFALWWLGEVVALGSDASHDWDAVAALHPAVQAFVNSEPEVTREAATRLVDLGALMARIVSWSSLRAEAAAGRSQVDAISPALARWLDDGAYSRWLLGTYPPLRELSAAVTELLPPATALQLRSVLAAWGLDASRP